MVTSCLFERPRKPNLDLAIIQDYNFNEFSVVQTYWRGEKFIIQIDSQELENLRTRCDDLEQENAKYQETIDDLEKKVDGYEDIGDRDDLEKFQDILDDYCGIDDLKAHLEDTSVIDDALDCFERQTGESLSGGQASERIESFHQIYKDLKDQLDKLQEDNDIMWRELRESRN